MVRGNDESRSASKRGGTGVAVGTIRVAATRVGTSAPVGTALAAIVGAGGVGSAAMGGIGVAGIAGPQPTSTKTSKPSIAFCINLTVL